MLRIALALAAAGLIVVGLAVPNGQVAQADSGVSPTINFQGRLLSAAGAVVADGNYNAEFKIYEEGDGTQAGDAVHGAVPAGTLLWQEDWINDTAGTFSNTGPVVVKNGYFSVNLGTYCSLSGSTCQGNTNAGVNFNDTTLWLSMNVAGTPNQTVATCTPFSSCTPDGEMLPMNQMGSAPSAQNAANADQVNSFGVNNKLLNLAVPTIGSPSLVAGGTLSSGQIYFYQVTAVNSTGETLPSASASDTATGATLSIKVPWTVVPGATSYKIYRNTTNSFTSGSLLLTTVTNGSLSSFTDIGSATAAGLPPTTATGSTVTIQGWSGQTANLLQLQNAAGTTIASVDENGNAFVASSLDTQTATTLNIGGTNATAVSIANNNIAHTINIGAGGSSTVQQINIGSNSAVATTVSIQGGTTANTAVQIGASGTGGITIDSGGAGAVLLGNSHATTVTLGNTSATTTTIQGNTAIDIGAGMTTGSIVIGGTAATTGNITVGSTTGAGESVLIGNGTGAGTVTLASGSTVGNTVNVETDATASGIDAVNIDTGNAAGTKTVNIANGTPTGSGVNNVTIGSTGLASKTILQGGNGTIAGTGAAVQLNTAAAADITIGAATHTGIIDLGQSTAGETINVGNGNVATGLTNNINIGATATSTGKDVVTVGSLIAASTTTIQGGTTGTAIALTTGNGGAIALNASAGTGAIGLTTGAANITLTSNGATSGVVVKSTTNSTLALQVQNTSGNGVLTVDTSSNTGQGQVILGKASTNKGALIFSDSGSANLATLTTVTGAVGSIVFSLPTNIAGAAQTICTSAAGSCSGTYLTAAGAVLQSPTSTQTINPGANTATGLIIQQSSSATLSDVFDIYGSSGATNKFLQVTTTAANAGAVTLQSLGSNALTLQSGNATVSLGSSTALIASGALAVHSGGATAMTLDTGGGAALTLGGTNATSVVIGGNTAGTIKEEAANSSTSAFILQEAGGTQILVADSQNGLLYVGGSASSTTPELFVLGQLTSGSTAPTEVDGAMYYDQTTDSFRCGENTRWAGCSGLAGAQIGPSTVTNPALNTVVQVGSSITIPANDCQPGVVYMITASGTASVNASANTLSFGVYEDGGSNDLAGSGSFAPANAATVDGWYMDATMTCQGSDEVETGGTTEVDSATAARPQSGVAKNTAPQGWTIASSHTFKIGIEFAGATGANNIVTMREFAVQRLAP